MAAEDGDGIIVLSPAWNPHPEKTAAAIRQKSAAMVAVRKDLNPKMDVETEAENQPVETNCQKRRSGDVPPFARAARSAYLGTGLVGGRAGSAQNPNIVSISFAGDKAFPAREPRPLPARSDWHR
jgi:hypothetical protein